MIDFLCFGDFPFGKGRTSPGKSGRIFYDGLFKRISLDFFGDREDYPV